MWTLRIFRIAFPLCTLLVVGCKNEQQVREQATQTATEQATEQQRNRSVPEGKIALLTDNTITLDNTKSIALPPKDGKETTTIFFVRHAEIMEGKTSLSEIGRARAGYLSQVMAQAGLAQIYCDQTNSSLQTALQTARSNQCELNYFQPEMASVMLSTIVHSFKGKRVMVVGTAQTLTNLLGEVSGVNDYTVSPQTYDHIFLVTVKEVGKGQVRHLMY